MTISEIDARIVKKLALRDAAVVELTHHRAEAARGEALLQELDASIQYLAEARRKFAPS